MANSTQSSQQSANTSPGVTVQKSGAKIGESAQARVARAVSEARQGIGPNAGNEQKAAADTIKDINRSSRPPEGQKEIIVVQKEDGTRIATLTNTDNKTTRSVPLSQISPELRQAYEQNQRENLISQNTLNKQKNDTSIQTGTTDGVSDSDSILGRSDSSNPTPLQDYYEGSKEALKSAVINPLIDSGKGAALIFIPDAYKRILRAIPTSDDVKPLKLESAFLDRINGVTVPPVPEEQQGVLGKQILAALNKPGEGIPENQFVDKLRGNRIDLFQEPNQGAAIKFIQETFSKIPTSDSVQPLKLESPLLQRFEEAKANIPRPEQRQLDFTQGQGIPQNDFINRVQANRMQVNTEQGLAIDLIQEQLDRIPKGNQRPEFLDFKSPLIQAENKVPEEQQGVLGKQILAALNKPGEGIPENNFKKILESNQFDFTLSPGKSVGERIVDFLNEGPQGPIPGSQNRFLNIEPVPPVPEEQQGVLGKQILKSYLDEKNRREPFAREFSFGSEGVSARIDEYKDRPEVETLAVTAAIVGGSVAFPPVGEGLALYFGASATEDLIKNPTPKQFGKSTTELLLLGIPQKALSEVRDLNVRLKGIEIPASKVIPQEVLSGEKRFAEVSAFNVKTPEELILEFKESKFAKNIGEKEGGFTASPVPIAGTVEIRPQKYVSVPGAEILRDTFGTVEVKAGQPLQFEQAGIFVAPSVSPYFLKTAGEGEIGFSLLPQTSKPTVQFIRAIDVLPTTQAELREPGKLYLTPAVTKFLTGKGEGPAKPEAEAQIPPGTFLKFIDSDFFFEYNGRAVPIKVYEPTNIGEGIVPKAIAAIDQKLFEKEFYGSSFAKEKTISISEIGSFVSNLKSIPVENSQIDSEVSSIRSSIARELIFSSSITSEETSVRSNSSDSQSILSIGSGTPSVPSQPRPELSIPSIPSIPSLTPPTPRPGKKKKPFLSLDEDESTIKVPGFDVILLEGGKQVKGNVKALSEREAKQLGFEITANTLAASFKVVRTGFSVDAPSKRQNARGRQYIDPDDYEFGRSKLTEGFLVQKAKARLGSPGEISEIQGSKKQRGGFRIDL